MIELDGDTAKVRSNLLGTYVFAEDPSQALILKGVYEDKAVRTANGWRLSWCRPHRTNETGVI